MNAPNFLHNEVEERENFTRAIATIIEDIQKAHPRDGRPMSDTELAESIDVSKGTIANAKYGRNGLGSLYLSRLGKKYGVAFLNPYLALMGGEASPIKPVAETNLAPLVAKVNLKLVEASDPRGPGGVAHVPQERSAYLPDLKAMNRETALAIREIEESLA
jgi:hypothetical protein